MIEEDQSDKILVERFIAGDQSALAVLVKRWHLIFCEKAFWVLQDKHLSKDVAQECWIIIIKKLQTLKNADSFKGWALRIIYTKAIDAHKRRIKELHKSNEIPKKENEDLKDTDHKTMLQKRLLNGIQALSKERQHVIRLFYIEEYSLKEISAILEIPIGTVKSRLFKAREKLKSIIKSYDHEK